MWLRVRAIHHGHVLFPYKPYVGVASLIDDPPFARNTPSISAQRIIGLIGSAKRVSKSLTVLVVHNLMVPSTGVKLRNNSIFATSPKAEEIAVSWTKMAYTSPIGVPETDQNSGNTARLLVRTLV